MVLEQPVAQVDGQVDLVGLRNRYLSLFVLQVHCHELVANLRSVLSVVIQTELAFVLGIHIRRALAVFGATVLLFGLGFLLPADLVEALAEQDDIGKHSVEEEIVFDFFRDGPQIKREYFINQHRSAVFIVQVRVRPSLEVFFRRWARLSLVHLQMLQVLVQRVFVELLFFLSNQVVVLSLEALQHVGCYSLPVRSLEVVVVLWIASL